MHGTQSSTWSKGNTDKGISTQILLAVTTLSVCSPPPGHRPVPAAGIHVCRGVCSTDAAVNTRFLR